MLERIEFDQLTLSITRYRRVYEFADYKSVYVGFFRVLLNVSKRRGSGPPS